MKERKVSVIIPTFKRSDFLCRAIDSVLKQTYKNIEIIVVDDNGNDSVYRLENENKLKKYGNKIVFLKHEVNKNGAAARNTGLNYATGDYISFLDDDDIYVSNRIEKMVKTLEENLEYDGCYSNVAFSYYGKIYDVLNTKGDGNFQLNTLKMENVIGTGSNLFFRREIVNKIGLFDVKFLRNQDIEYLIRFFEYGKIKEIDEVLVIKCKEDECNFSSNIELMLNVKKIFFEKFKKIISKYNDEVDDIYICNYLPIYINAHKSRKFRYLIPKIYNVLIEHGYKETLKNKVKCRIYKLLNPTIINYLYREKMHFIILKSVKKYKKTDYISNIGEK